MRRFLAIQFTCLLLANLCGLLWTANGAASIQSQAAQGAQSAQGTQSAQGSKESQVSEPQVSKQGQSVLKWVSGDELPGRIVSYRDGELVWQSSSLFTEPLRLQSEFLQAIDGKTNGSLKSASKPQPTGYTIQMMDGCVLTGDILELNSKHLLVESKKTGRLKLNRENVRSFVSRNARFASNKDRLDLDVWDADRGEKKYWRLNTEGRIESTRQNVHLFMKEPFSDSVMIECEIQWKKKLDFMLGFGVPNNSRKLNRLPRLEVWADSLVFFYGDTFEPVIESIDASDKTLKLVILWDRKSGNMLIRDAAGNQLASLVAKPPSENKVKTGIFLQNKLGDLTLKSLSIWQAAAEFDASKPAIHLEGENSQNGELVSFDGKKWKIQQGGKTSERTSEELKGAFFSNAPRRGPSPPQTLFFANGDRVSGELLEINDNVATCKTDSIPDAFTLKLDELWQLNWNDHTKDVKKTKSIYAATLFTRAGQIKGRLVPGSGKIGDVLRWEVPGAVESVPFAYGDSKIVLKEDKAQDPGKKSTAAGEADQQSWPDTLYFLNGDILPCRVEKMDEKTVYFDSFTEIKQVDQKHLKAVDLYSTTTEYPVSNEDPLWKITKSNGRGVSQKSDSLVLTKGGAIEHPSLMSTGSMRFRAKWSQQGCLECSLFGGANSEAGLELRLGLFSKAIYVCDQQGNPTGKVYKCKSNSADFEFRVVFDRIEILCDGQRIYSQKLKPQQSSGQGGKFRIINTFGSRSQIRLSKFANLVAEFGNGNLVQKARRELLLTIPRLKKELPPKNILCARNHDLFRGDVVALNERQIRVRADGDLVTFPREVVGSIVWLHAEHLAREGEEESGDSKPDAAPTKPNKSDIATTPESNAGGEVQFVLERNRRWSSVVNGWKEDQFMGQSSTLGGCKIPFDEVLELRMGSYTNQSKDVPYADWVAQLAPSPKLETAAAGAGSSTGFGENSELIGQKFDSMQLTMLSGKNPRLKDFHGKVVVLDFWATWCGPCVKSLPKIQDVVAGFSDDQVILIAVNQEESHKQVKQFLEQKKLELNNVALDSGTLSRKFKVDAIPQTVIIDAEGTVRHVKVGSTPDMESKLKAAIEKLLQPAVAN